MAGPCASCCFCWNPFSISKDEPTKQTLGASINSSDFYTSLSFLLALIASSAPHFNRELFIRFKEFTELKKLQLISRDSCAPNINISHALTLIFACTLTLFFIKKPFKRLLKAQMESLNFGSNGASRTILHAKRHHQNPWLLLYSIGSLFDAQNGCATIDRRNKLFKRLAAPCCYLSALR